MIFEWLMEKLFSFLTLFMQRLPVMPEFFMNFRDAHGLPAEQEVWVGVVSMFVDLPQIIDAVLLMVTAISVWISLQIVMWLLVKGRVLGGGK